MRTSSAVIPSNHSHSDYRESGRGCGSRHGRGRGCGRGHVGWTFRRMACMALAVAGMLSSAACSGGISDSARTTDVVANGAYHEAHGGELHIYTWAGYMPDDVIKKFEKETGIKLTVDTFESNEALEAKLQSTGGSGYDIVMPSDYMVYQLIQEHMLVKFDVSKLPNGKNVSKEFSSPYYDPKLEYSAPYVVGYTGFMVNTKKIPKSAAPTSWKEFFALSSKYGKSQLLNDSIEVTNAALRAVGSDQCTTDAHAYQNANDLLQSYRSKVGVVSSEGVADRLASGEQVIGMIWSYDAYQAQQSNKDLEFVYPSDGTTQFVDNMAIAAGAQNIDQAKTFINYMLDPKNKEAIDESAGAGSVLKGGGALLPSEMRSSNTIVPSADELKHAVTEKACSNAINDNYTQLFENFKQ